MPVDDIWQFNFYYYLDLELENARINAKCDVQMVNEMV